VRFALVTEDPVLTRDLTGCFASDPIVIEPFSAGQDFLRAARATMYDLVLIDAQNSSLLLDVLQSSRNSDATVGTPVVVLTPFPDWAAMLGWINAGATDVAYRYDLEQVRLRAHVVLQRETHRAAGADTIELGSYVLRKDVGLVALDGVEIPLTPREFTIAWLFFSNPGRFLSRAQIAGSVWGSREHVASRSIEQHVYKLRKKLRLSHASGLNLKTVYALGYRLDSVLSVSPPDGQTGAPKPGAARPSCAMQSDAREQGADVADA
jgi:DNA-binding response OmpR family regulator